MMKALVVTSIILIGDFTVTDEDQKNILGICDIAAKSPEQLPRDVRYGIAGYCLGWQRRMEAAAQPKEDPNAKQNR